MSSQRRIQFSIEPAEVFYLCPADHKAENKVGKKVCSMRLWPKNPDMPLIEEEYDAKYPHVDSDDEEDEIMSLEALNASRQRRRRRARTQSHALSKLYKRATEFAIWQQNKMYFPTCYE